MYQILIPKNRNLVIFQNERFKLWDYSKLESLMEPWPQFADKKFAVEWVNYFLCKISLIFENEYDIEYANVFALKNLDTNEVLLYWCKEVMFNSADKKNVTLTLVMDVFSKEILKNYKLTGTITQSTLPECRYYYKDNKLVFDNANMVYNEGFQFPKTSSTFQVVYSTKEVVNNTQHLFYINQQVVFNPLHCILDPNYLNDNSKTEKDYGQGGIVYIWESDEFLTYALDCADANVLKVVSPCLYFSFINLGTILGHHSDDLNDSSNLPSFNTEFDNPSEGIDNNGLVLSARYARFFTSVYSDDISTYNNNFIEINAKDDFYNAYGIANGLITLFKRDLTADTYQVTDFSNVTNYLDENDFYIDEFVINEGKLLETGSIVVNYYDEELQEYQILIGYNNYENELAGFIWEPYRYQYYNILKCEQYEINDQQDSTGIYNREDETYKTSNVYKTYVDSNIKWIGSVITDLNNYSANNDYMYRFNTKLYNDENYDIKLFLSSIHNGLYLISGSFTYEITSYESFIYSDTLIGYLQEFLLVGENNKIAITFKNRDGNKYINLVDCYDYYLKKSDSYTDYMLTNGSQYMTAKSYASTMVDLTQQMNSAKEGIAIFDSIMSIFSAVTSTGASILSGASEFGVMGAGVMGANSGVRGVQNIGDSVGNIVTTQIQNQMNLATAQNAVNMLNAQANDLKRNLDVSFSNKGFDYLSIVKSYGGNVGDILLYSVSYSSDVMDKINWFYKIYGWKNGNQFELTNNVKKSPKFDYVEMQNIFTTGLPAIWKDMVVNFFKAGIWLINDETIEDINAVEFKDNILYE